MSLCIGINVINTIVLVSFLCNFVRSDALKVSAWMRVRVNDVHYHVVDICQKEPTFLAQRHMFK